MAMDQELLDIGRAQRAFDKLTIPARKYLLDRLNEELDKPVNNHESDTPIADAMEAQAANA